jgi:pseudouridine synthase
MNSSKRSSKPSSRTASNAGEPLRLNRYLADCGLGARRKVEQLIVAGKIMVNGEVCVDLARRIDIANDTVLYDGKELHPRTRFLYLILNKPRGYVVSRSDELGRDTIYKLLPEGAKDLTYAGRLDRNSEGLLLMTNDGDMINRLTHPNFKVEKVYKVETTSRLSKAQLDQLRAGVLIEGGMTRSAGVYVKNETERGMTLKVVITEGRKRQVRNMFRAVGANVRALKRLQFGPLMLKSLPLGQWRPLTDGELRALKAVTRKGKTQ